jgi:hypothetical protein
MANTVISCDEIRFDVRDPEITHCYVFINNLSNDGMLGVHGWHHKAFPSRMSVTDIMQAWQNGEEDPLMWPQQAPEQK